MRGSQNHHIRSIGREPLLDLDLTLQIRFGAGCGERREAARRQRSHNCTADHAAMPRDVDALAFKRKESGLRHFTRLQRHARICSGHPRLAWF